jgi:hypothetical protein
MFLTYISKNFDDGPVSFETFCLVIFAVSVLFPKSLTNVVVFSIRSYRYFLAGRKGSLDF